MHYKLPTTYDSFLYVIDYFRRGFLTFPLNVGRVFNQLSSSCSCIANSYYEYKDKYDALNIDPSKIPTIQLKSYSNCWINYLIDTYGKSVNWIDFELEIDNVLRIFKEFLSDNRATIKNNSRLTFSLNDKYSSISYFDFFFTSIGNKDMYYVKPEYADIYEEKLKVKEIVDGLFDSLQDLTKMLAEYLNAFVEPISKECIEKSTALCKIDRVINFNYTKTFESVFFDDEDKICHLHGVLGNDIILGVNPNEDDELPNIDTTFIKFKKNYQRELYKTSDKYFYFYREKTSKILENVIRAQTQPFDTGNTPNDAYKVSVCGHSLGHSDEAIIKMFFDKATHIVIYYHNEAARLGYIESLISIYGANEFQKLQAEKYLEFKIIEELFEETVLGSD